MRQGGALPGLTESGLHRVLFICGKARHRSPTAADLANLEPGLEADFAGLSADADERVSREQIDWSDTIAVMERRQAARLKRQFGAALRGKRVTCLNVPDRYVYGAPDLVARLRPEIGRLRGG